MRCQEILGGPKRPHDAHDGGSWGAAGTSKCATCAASLQHPVGEKLGTRTPESLGSG